MRVLLRVVRGGLVRVLVVFGVLCWLIINVIFSGELEWDIS